MFLLNDLMIKAHNKRGGLIEIEPFDESGLCPTYYYFRLGKRYQKWDAQGEAKFEMLADGKEILTIGAGEYVLVESYERFRCSKQILAIFGQSSSLTRRGLKLVHSPFIDPNFPAENDQGYLELGLKNELSSPVTLKLHDRIGKICFYNVADTYPIRDVEGTASEADYRRRQGHAGPTPLYDDHPVEGWKGVENAGAKHKR